MTDIRAELLAGLLERLSDYVLDPPHGDDRVVDYGDADSIRAAFAASVGV